MDRISEMIARLEAEVRGVVDLPRAISLLVRHGVEQEVDPYITMGVLVESIVHTLAHAVPAERRVDAAKGVTTLLLNRFVSQHLTK